MSAPALMPDSAIEELRRILMLPEFNFKQQSIWEQLLKHYAPELENLADSLWQSLKRLREWFGNFMPDSIGNSFLPEWLRGLLSFVAENFVLGLKLLLAGMVLFAILRLALPVLRQLFPKTDAVKAAVTGKEKRVRRSPSELFQSGDLTGLVSELRLLAREKLERDYLFSSTATDREISKLLKQDTPVEALFKRIVTMFEEIAFARNTPSEQLVKTLYNDFEVQFQKS